jgi:atypical dual specificity phosphatase
MLPAPAPRWFTVRNPRLLGGEHPCPGGDVRLHRTRLAQLLELGVTTFVDLTEYERENGIQPYRGRLARAAHGSLHACYHTFPMRDAAVPQSAAQVETILDLIDIALLNDERVYVHCRSGVGRTGTVLALHLVRRGYTPREALRLVQAAWRKDPRSSLWPRSPQTEAQRRYVMQAGK